ncbi:ComEC or Rec2-related protein [Streptomyces venezuelae]|nr:ComEC or Rec2-related protein [Streptomyces venezuelae]
MNRAGGTGEEGPVDLRLVPLALAAWAAAACAVGVTGWWTVAGVTVCLVGAFALLAPVLARRLGAADGSRDAEGGGPDAPVASPVTPGWRLRATACAGVLLCAAAGAASAGLHAADLRRGPVPALAREYVRAQMEVTVTSDPRLTRPQVRGNAMAPVSVVLGGEVTRVERPGGAAHRTRAPVLLIVPPGEAREEWLRLLPSTRLRVGARLALPLRSGEPFAAILKVDGAGPPRIVGPPSAPQRTAGELRAGLRRATEGLAPNARALLPGLVVGDTSRIGPELRDAFEATDLTHLLAVSGSNLSVVLLLLIGRPGRAHQVERGGLAPRLGLSLRATAVAGGALTLAFVVVCRPDPSVLRAAACGLVVLLAIGTGRRRSLIPALATAVLLLVLYDPWLARSYGFLLSVLATGALLTVAPRWSEALRRRRVPGRLAEALAAALAAQAVCAPVVVVFAGRVSLVAIPANLFAELAVAPATVLGFAALALAQVWEPAAAGVAWVAGWPAGWIAGVARAGGELPGAQLAWPGGWWGGLVLALLTGLVVLGARRLPYRGWIAGFVAALILLVAVRPVPLTRWATGWPPPGWVFAMCQVGQGDATVLAAGGDAAVVVDAGPDPVPVDRCLRELGVRRVPLLVLTHFHADHVAGLAGVLRGAVGGGDPDHGARRAARAGRVRAEDGGRRWGAARPGGGGGAPEGRGVGVAGGVATGRSGRICRRVGRRGERRQCHPPCPGRRRAESAAPGRPRTTGSARASEERSGAGAGGCPQGRPPRVRAPGSGADTGGAAASRAGVGGSRQPVRTSVAPDRGGVAGRWGAGAADRSGRGRRGGGCGARAHGRGEGRVSRRGEGASRCKETLVKKSF